jgi:anti-anti-sigma factor
MNYHEELVGGVTVLEVLGRVDSTSAPTLSERLSMVLSGKGQCAVVDLNTIDYVSSAGFRVLLLAAKRADDTDGKLVLCSMSSKLRQLFALSGFLDLFSITNTREEALALLAV